MPLSSMSTLRKRVLTRLSFLWVTASRLNYSCGAVQGAGEPGQQKAKIQFAHAQGLAATLPAVCNDGPFLIWAGNASGWSRPIRLNVPQPWWCGPDVASPGDSVRIFGRNLARRPEYMAAFVYLALPGRSGVWLNTEQTGKYSVTVRLPAQLDLGTYEIWVHAGSGGALVGADRQAEISGSNTYSEPRTAETGPRIVFGPQPCRRIHLQLPILDKNDRLAARNRAFARSRGIAALNLVSSPGSGKTALQERTLDASSAGRQRRRPSSATSRPTTMRSASGRAMRRSPRSRPGRPPPGRRDGGARRRGPRSGRRADPLHRKRWQLPPPGPVRPWRGRPRRCPPGRQRKARTSPSSTLPSSSRRTWSTTKIDVAEVLGFDRAAAARNIRAIAPQARLIELSARTGRGNGRARRLCDPKPEASAPRSPDGGRLINPKLQSVPPPGHGRRLRIRQLDRRLPPRAATVQGVGFRPFVLRAATRLHLAGWVRNDSRGVLIRAAGDRPSVDSLVCVPKAQAPPAARVVSVEQQPDPPRPPAGDAEFVILPSEADRPEVSTAAPPDLALCPDCRGELLDAVDL